MKVSVMVYNSLSPQFDSMMSEEVVLPYRSEPYRRFFFKDPMLAGYEVTVIEDSLPLKMERKDDEGDRIVTIVARFPRCILAEVNTHRVFSRNSASSRARSMKQTIHDIMSDTFVPLFTKNKKGMSGDFLSFDDRNNAIDVWNDARDSAVYSSLRLLLGDLMPMDHSIQEIALDYEKLLNVYYDQVYNAEIPDSMAISVHKQNANRVLEPFMWHESIITSTYWKNFLELRTNLDNAQPEIVALALLVKAALEDSVPVERWVHAPFVDDDDIPENYSSFENIKDTVLLSATECAQISYKDKSNASKSTASVGLGERLLKSKHLSPFEHVAFSSAVYHSSEAGEDLPIGDKVKSNFSDSWVQLRPILDR